MRLVTAPGLGVAAVLATAYLVAPSVLQVGTVAHGKEQAAPPAGRAEAVRSVRLFVLDGGILESDPGRYRLKPEEVATTQLSVAAYLVAHPGAR